MTMTDTRYYQIVYALVLCGLTVSACTFFYVFAKRWDRLHGATDAPLQERAAQQNGKAWTLHDSAAMLNERLPMQLPDPLQGDFIDSHSTPLDDLSSGADPELGEGERFVLRHPALSEKQALPPFEIFIGAPGMYPPLRLESNARGEFTAPLRDLQMLDGELLDQIEILVRPANMFASRGVGVWKSVSISSLDEVACYGEGYRCHAMDLFDVAPFRVRVVNASGERLAHANARLAADRVGLVHLKEDALVVEEGELVFGALPAGDYLLSIKAKGYLGEEVMIPHVLPEVSPQGDELYGEDVVHEVMLEQGKSLYGRVVDEEGRGVVDAFITVHVDRYGEPEVLPIESFSNIESVPVKGIANTGEDGYFAVSGLPSGVAYVTAMSTFGMPSLSRPVDLRGVAEAGPVRLVLGEGADVEVEVLGPEDEGGAPISGVPVYWRDGSSGLRAESVTDASGLAIFEEVPPGAKFWASFERWSTLPHALDSPDGDGVYRLRMQLEPPGTRQDLTLRILPPARSDVAIRDVSFRSSAQDACDGSRKDARDWILRSCKHGAQGWIEVHTAKHGTWTEPVTLDFVTILYMPQPKRAQVKLLSWPSPPESMDVLATTSSTRWQVPLQVYDRRGDHRHAEMALYEGRYELQVVDEQGESQRQTLQVEGAETMLEWRPITRHTLRVDVTDHRDHPIREGFFAVLVADEPSPRDVRQRNAAHIVPLTTRDLEEEHEKILLACGPASGCVSHRITAADFERERLVLRTPGEALSATGTPQLGAVTTTARAESILGEAIVTDNLRLLVDVLSTKDTPSVARQLGIARGDALLFLSVLEPTEDELVAAGVELDDADRARHRKITSVVLSAEDASWRILSKIVEIEL